MTEPTKPLVIYHANCWDGFCAAWVARKAFGNIDAVPAHYGTEPPDATGRRVYLLDFSYPRPLMRRLLSQAQLVVVLDHHKTAQAELGGLCDEFVMRPDLFVNPVGSELPFIRFDMGKSGGRLAWEYFFPSAPSSPWLVDYTEDRDLWRHGLEWTQEINAALRSYPLDFATWDALQLKPCSDLVHEGTAIRRVERQMVETHVRHARAVTLAGHRIKAVNATVLFSEIAGELAKGEPFAACYFDRFDGKRQWSLRSDENGLDVSEIAKQFGGGGHARAAGFEEVVGHD